MILAAFTGLYFVTASPTPTGLAANSKSASLERRAGFRWDPANSHPNKKEWRKKWERMCVKALDDNDCPYGIIHLGHHDEKGPDGEKTGRTYHNVEEEKLHADHNPKLLRVFHDGTVKLGWWNADRQLIKDNKKYVRWYARNGVAKNAKRRAARRKARQQSLERMNGPSSSEGNAEGMAEQQLASPKRPTSSGGSTDRMDEQQLASSNELHTPQGSTPRKAGQQLGRSNGPRSSEGFADNDPYLEDWSSMLEQAKRRKVDTPPHSPAEQGFSPSKSRPMCFRSFKDLEAFLELC